MKEMKKNNPLLKLYNRPIIHVMYFDCCFLLFIPVETTYVTLKRSSTHALRVLVTFTAESVGFLSSHRFFKKPLLKLHALVSVWNLRRWHCHADPATVGGRHIQITMTNMGMLDQSYEVCSP